MLDGAILAALEHARAMSPDDFARARSEVAESMEELRRAAKSKDLINLFHQEVGEEACEAAAENLPDDYVDAFPGDEADSAQPGGDAPDLMDGLQAPPQDEGALVPDAMDAPTVQEIEPGDDPEVAPDGDSMAAGPLTALPPPPPMGAGCKNGPPSGRVGARPML